MKKAFTIILFTLFSVSGLVLLTISCSSDQQRPEKEIEEEITKLVHQLYKDYSNSNLEKFSSFYHEDVIRMDIDGCYQVGKDVFVEGWEKSYERMNMVLLDYSEPTVFVGQNQTVTFNTYDELFIDRKTGDTTRVKGTWIGMWKQQLDESWK